MSAIPVRERIRAAVRQQWHQTTQLPKFFHISPQAWYLVNFCVIDFPSPLDEHLPLRNKIALFLLAGFFEYLQISTVAHFCHLILVFALHIPYDIVGNGPHSFVIWSLCIFGFCLRANTFTWHLRNRRTENRLRHYVAMLLYHNPAVVFHVLLRTLVPWLLGVSVMRVRAKLLSVYAFCMSPFFWKWPGTPTWFWNPEAAETQTDVRSISQRVEGIVFSYLKTVAFAGPMEYALLGFPPLVVTVTLIFQAYPVEGRRPTPVQSVRVSQVQKVALRILSTTPREILQLIGKRGPVFDGQSTWRQALSAPLTAPIKRLFHGLWRTCQQNPSVDPKASKQIRLLHVLPSITGDDLPWCRLVWYDIDSLPAYTAYSYSWGRYAPDRPSVVNGSIVHLTKSADDLIRRIRSPWRTRVIWIDALCIDQDDPVDKATHSDPLMPVIYGHAAEVLVYLGTAPPRAAALAACLVKRLYLHNRFRSEVPSHDPEPDLVSREAARALKRLLTRAWFGRTWIVQEVVQANCPIWILYGDWDMQWAHLSGFADVLRLDPWMRSVLT